LIVMNKQAEENALMDSEVNKIKASDLKNLHLDESEPANASALEN
jgi:hypothetical protein